MASTNDERIARFESVIRRGFDDYFSDGVTNAVLNYLRFVFDNGGGGTGGVTEDHIFESAEARDIYFTTRTEELILGTPIVVQLGTPGSPNVRYQIWAGENQPATYPDPITNQWADGGPTGLTVPQMQVLTALIAVSEDSIPIRTATGYADSSLSETADEVQSTKNFFAPEIRTQTGSFLLDEAIRLSSNSQCMDVRDEIREQDAELVRTKFDAANGSQTTQQVSLEALATFDVHLVQDEQSTSFSTVFPTINAVKFERFIVIPNEAGAGTFMVRFTDAAGKLLISMFTVDFEAADVGQETEFMLLSTINLDVGEFIHVTYTGIPLAGHQYSSDPIWGNQFVMFARTMSYPRSMQNLATEDFVNNLINSVFSISDFSINIPSIIDLNTDLGTRTVTYSVSDYSRVTSIVLQSNGATFATLTIPTTNGDQSENVNFSSLDTTADETYVFRIQSNGSVNSNTQTLTVRAPLQSEAFYYGVSDADNPETIDVSTLTRRNIARTESFDADFVLPTNNYAIILIPNNYALGIIERTFNQNIISDFTLTNNVRAIGGQMYDSYVHENQADTQGTLATRITVTV